MPVKLISSPNYNNERTRIMGCVVGRSVKTGDDAIPVLKFFRKEERELQKRIKASLLSAGVDFPRPVKKGTSGSGNYVILYTHPPSDATGTLSSEPI